MQSSKFSLNLILGRHSLIHSDKERLSSRQPLSLWINGNTHAESAKCKQL